jgi:hypothetical protein
MDYSTGNHQKEIAALTELRSLLGTPEGEDNVELFIEHHLAELEADYFSKALGTPKPEASLVLSSLVLVASWSYEDDGIINVFDFSLPEEVTNFVLSVRFSGDEVEEVSMES